MAALLCCEKVMALRIERLRSDVFASQAVCASHGSYMSGVLLPLVEVTCLSEQGLMAVLVLHSGEQLRSITLQCYFLLLLLKKFHALELKVSTLSGDLFSDELLLCSIAPTIWLFELQYFFIMISLVSDSLPCEGQSAGMFGRGKYRLTNLLNNGIDY